MALVVMGLGTSASAQAPITVRWEGALCAEARERLTDEVLALVAISPDAVGLDVGATISGDAPLRLALDLSRDGEPVGRRVLEGAECSELISAAALVVALTIDPAAVTEALPPTGEAPVPVAAPEAPTVAVSNGPAAALGQPPVLGVSLSTTADERSASAPTPSRSASTNREIQRARDPRVAPEAPSTTEEASAHPTTRTPLGLSLGISAVLDVGALPLVAPGVEARVGLALGPLRLEGAARYLAEQGTAFTQHHPTARGSFGLAAGSLGACLPVGVGPVAIGPCLGLEAGAIWGSTTGVTDPGAATSPWLAPWATGQLAVDVARWLRLRMDLGISVPIVQTDFVVDGLGVVHTASPVTFRLGLGAEVHFR